MKLYKRVIVVAVGLLLLISALRSLFSIAEDVPVMANMDTLPVIIIDPGHGGIDGGAVGVDGIVEKDINLAVCLTMRDIFVANGFEVVMTRSTDISIHDSGITSTRKQKVSDLHNRLAIANAYPNAIFISLHQNKFGDKRSRGAQIFYSANNPQSEKLAQLLQEKFAEKLQPENHRQIKKAGKNLYLMYHAQNTAVLVECGFLSNQEEAEQLIDPEYQSKLAFTTFCAVMEFLDMQAPQSLA